MFIIRLAAEALSIADSKASSGSDPKISRHQSNNNFLYNILSGQEDTSTAQQRSQLCPTSTLDAYRLHHQKQQRSNSVVLHRPRVKACSGERASSVPDSSHRFTPYPLHKRLHQADPATIKDHVSDSYSVDSPARSVSTDSGLDEPLDLTKQGHLLSSDGESTASSPLNMYNDMTFTIPQSCSPFLTPPTLKPHYDSDRTPTPISSQCVQLTKKMARPVQSRISDWLRQMVSLVVPQSSETCNSRITQLPASIRLRFLQASWHRILVLYMAEHSLRFVTSPIHVSSDEDTLSSAETKRTVRATQGFVDQLSDLIDHCASLPFDHSMYDFIRLAVILMGDQKTLDCSNFSLLEKYLNSRTDVSQLRSIMSEIEAISKDQLEALFCAHFSIPVEELLKLYFDEQLSMSNL